MYIFSIDHTSDIHQVGGNAGTICSILRRAIFTIQFLLIIQWVGAMNPLLTNPPPPSTWDELGGGFYGSGSVADVKFDTLGRIVLAGTGLPYYVLPRWNGAGWDELGLTTWHNVYAIEYDASGVLYAATGAYNYETYNWVHEISYHDGSSWNLIGTISGPARDLIFSPEGHLYVCGSFVSINGVTCNSVAKWDGVEWTALGSGFHYDYYGYLWLGEAYQMAIGSDSSLLIGGSFNRVDGVHIDQFAIYKEGQGWSTLNGGIDLGTVNTIEVDEDGTIYLGGYGNYPTHLSSVVMWNGSSWVSLGDWGENGYVEDLEFDTMGNLFCVGGFSLAGGVVTQKMAVWTGTNWLNPGGGVLDGGYVHAICSKGEGSFGVGGAFYTPGFTMNLVGIFTPDTSLTGSPLKFRTKVSGAWSDILTWEVFNGTSWIPADEVPSSSADTIFILPGHTVDAANILRDVDQLIIAGTVLNALFSVINGPGTDIIIEESGMITTSMNQYWTLGSGTTIFSNGEFSSGAAMFNLDLTIGPLGSLYVGPSGTCYNYYGHSCKCDGELVFSGTITNYGVITVASGGIRGKYGGQNKIVNYGTILYKDPPDPPTGDCPYCCPAYAIPEWRRAELDNYGTFQMSGHYDLSLIEGSKCNNMPGGQVNVLEGNLALNSGGEDMGGVFYVASGSTLYIQFGLYEFEHETWFEGQGNLVFQTNNYGSGTSIFNALIHVEVPHVLMSNCCLFYVTGYGGDGEFRVTNGTVVDYVGGGWLDSTLIHVMEGAVFNFAPEPFFAMGPASLGPGVTLKNYGTVTSDNVNATGGFTLQNYGLVLLESEHFGNTTAQPNLACRFINHGSLHVSGGGEFPIITSLFHQTSSGAIWVHESTYLSPIGATLWEGGMTYIDSGAYLLFQAGVQTFLGNDTFQGPGSLKIVNSFFGGSFPTFSGDVFVNCGSFRLGSGAVVNGTLNIGPACHGIIELNPVTGSGAILNYGLLGGNTSILPDSIYNYGIISPGDQSFSSLTLTSSILNAGTIYAEVNGIQHDQVIFTGPVLLGGTLHVAEKPWPRFPVGDTVMVLSAPDGLSGTFDVLTGCFDTLYSSNKVTIHKIFEDVVACAMPYDTILIAPELDTIQLASPLHIDIPLTLLDEHGDRVVVVFDFTSPGFTGALQGLRVESDDPVIFDSFHLWQVGNDPTHPVIYNAGHLHVIDTRISGPTIPYIKNSPSAIFTASGVVEIGPEE